MEPDHASAETSDDPKPPSITTEQQHQSTIPTPRSYECNFCKRGFTNAQALGGHMNIHRKEKTKFKHSSTTTPPNAVMESPSPTRPRLSPATATTTATNPFSISRQGNWFSASPQDEKNPLPLSDHHDTVVPRDIHQRANPSSPEGDVDLELRLGHVEPPPESSSEKKTTTTRKFF